MVNEKIIISWASGLTGGQSKSVREGVLKQDDFLKGSPHVV